MLEEKVEALVNSSLFYNMEFIQHHSYFIWKG